MGSMEGDRRGQWLRGLLDICVLALLRDGESYGYELAQALDREGLGPIQGGTLYPLLTRMQRAGLITAFWREGDTGPARKYYRLTDDGQRELHQLRGTWLEFADRAASLLGRPDEP